MAKIITKIFFVTLSITCGLFAHQVRAEEILPDRISITPARVDTVVAPGTSVTKLVTITNTLPIPARISVSAEDVSGTKNGTDAVVLLGKEAGANSLKEFLKSTVRSFDLQSGESREVPIVVSLPTGVAHGGLYGAVIFTVTTEKAGSAKSVSGASVNTRIASLFFVRTPGNRIEEGKLASFFTSDNKKLYFSSPIEFTTSFENTGNVHLNTYGIFSVENMFGAKVYTGGIPPTFVLPQSVRDSNPIWQQEWWRVGYYRAEVQLNRGYGDIVDSARVGFFVISFPALIATFVCLVFLYQIGRRIKQRLALQNKHA